MEKTTPLKKKSPKNKKKWIIEYRHYISNLWLLKILKTKEGWSNWTNFQSYSTEKSCLTAYDVLMKRRKNATGIYGELERSYEYRIKK